MNKYEYRSRSVDEFDVTKIGQDLGNKNNDVIEWIKWYKIVTQ